MDTINISMDAKKLRKELEIARKRVHKLERQLRFAENHCDHDFTEAKYTPEYSGGYKDPGDPPGTMGVDRRLPSYIPKREHPKWTRECKICGKVETTEKSVEKVSKRPKF